MDGAQPVRQRPIKLALILAVAAVMALTVAIGGYLLLRGNGDGDASSAEDIPFDLDGYEFAGTIGEPTIPNAPIDVAVGPDGRVYIADLGLGRVLAYTAGGELDEGWGRGGLSDPLSAPAQVALDDEGNVYVLGLSSSEVSVLNRSGEQTGTWRATPDQETASLSRSPAALAVSGDTVHVLDSQLGQLRRYSTSGDELEPWALPDGMAVDIAASAGGVALLYRDVGNQTGILLLDANGEITGEIAPDTLAGDLDGREVSAVAFAPDGGIVALLDPETPEGPPGFAVIDAAGGTVDVTSIDGVDHLPALNNAPVSGFAVSPDGRVLIANPARQQVAIYGRTGDLLGRLAPRTLDGRFAGLDEIAVGPQGNVFAVDPILSRVIEFQPGGAVAQIYDFSEGRIPAFQTGFTRQRVHLAVSASGEVYVAGASPPAERPFPVIRFDSSGAITDGDWPGAVSFDGPLTVNVMTVGPDGLIYLVDDRAANEVQVFTADGESRGPLTEPFWNGAVQDVAVDGEMIYTIELDAGSSAVRAFSSGGDYLGALIELSGSAKTANRTGFALAPDGEGNLLVATSNVVSNPDAAPEFQYALHRLDEDGDLTKLGDLEIPFTTLPDIATAPDGTVYIAAPNDHRIYVYRPNP